MTTPASHDAYLAEQTPENRAALSELRARLAARLPGSEEVISYGLPGFRLGGKVLAGYGANKAFLSFYPHSGSLFPDMADRLKAAGFKHTKSALHFSPDRPIPDDLLDAILTARRAEAGV